MRKNEIVFARGACDPRILRGIIRREEGVVQWQNVSFVGALLPL